ncbi:hypothetical protein RND71_019706 [Anisodus tanguticus]|uniref:Pectate lyase n=1 Tax=Anisodus tanguticus TaxID=243964 RepID=A0AAE1S0Q4_9SOLA|nr:hypothetical protein RND71_019706 [Anisodus tanguticus]
MNGLLVLLFITFVTVGAAVPDNSTRRHLSKKYKGPCVAANLIDKCWRCDPRWADYRQKYASCAMGFGRKAIGGKGGRVYVVTDNSDDDVQNPKPGTLRHAVIQKEPLWIIFQKHMHIKLSKELLMQSYKTIDARGYNVHIEKGAGIKMQGGLSRPHWHKGYAIGGSSNATIISQGNRFIAQQNIALKEVTHRLKADESEWKNWTWLSQDDDMQNDAFFRTSGDQNALRKYKKLKLMPAEPSFRVGILTKFSGSLGCTVGRKC